MDAPGAEIGEVFLPGPGMERLVVSCGHKDQMGLAGDLDAACGFPMLHGW